MHCYVINLKVIFYTPICICNVVLSDELYQLSDWLLIVNIISLQQNFLRFSLIQLCWKRGKELRGC